MDLMYGVHTQLYAMSAKVPNTVQVADKLWMENFQNRLVYSNEDILSLTPINKWAPHSNKKTLSYILHCDLYDNKRS